MALGTAVICSLALIQSGRTRTHIGISNHAKEIICYEESVLATKAIHYLALPVLPLNYAL